METIKAAQIIPTEHELLCIDDKGRVWQWCDHGWELTLLMQNDSDEERTDFQWEPAS